MKDEIKECYETLSSKSIGLEETFLTAHRDLNVSKDDEMYARDACAKIIESLDKIRDIIRNFCGKSVTSGQGTSYTCGEHEWGDSSPIYQCRSCIKTERDCLLDKVKLLESVK